MEVRAADEFMAFCNDAKPGAACCYHLGVLARDASGTSRWELTRLARAAYVYQQRGLVCLTQRRLGEDAYAYLATRTQRPSEEAMAIGRTLQANAAKNIPSYVLKSGKKPNGW